MTCRLACDETLLSILEKTGTPAYVYDLDVMLKRVDEFRRSITTDNFVLLFATMANPASEVLGALAQAHVGACVNSIAHLEIAIRAGIPASRIQFTASGLSKSQMEDLLAIGVRVNLDSLGQLASWIECGGSAAGLRVNAASLLGQRGDRLGLHVSEIDSAVRLALKREARIEGLHVYMGTNFQSAEAMFPILQAFYRAAEGVESLSYVNVGGGVGVDYARRGSKFDIEAFGNELSRLHKLATAGRKIALYFEPGRGLLAEAGIFLSRVTDKKNLGGATFVAVDASVAIFPRPFHQPESPHHVRAIGSTLGEQQEVTVVGRTTFSRDILARCFLPKGLKVGDILVFEDAGAYCSSMASRFLGQPEPAAHFLALER